MSTSGPGPPTSALPRFRFPLSESFHSDDGLSRATSYAWRCNRLRLSRSTPPNRRSGRFDPRVGGAGGQCREPRRWRCHASSDRDGPADPVRTANNRSPGCNIAGVAVTAARSHAAVGADGTREAAPWRSAMNAIASSANVADDTALIDERQLCADLGISSVTATKWRAKAEGPPFIKVGRLVRYRRRDVEAWLVSRTVGRAPSHAAPPDRGAQLPSSAWSPANSTATERRIGSKSPLR